MKLTWVIVVVAIGIILVVIYQVRKKQVVVIGNNFAKAAAAEQERKRKNDSGKSPMSAMTYDFWRGEQSLVNPIKNSLDSELSGLAHRFAKSSAQVRADMRTSISMDEFYTLLSFSRRSAVFAINEQNVNWVTSGLTAIA